jgi:DNA-binding transcriptional ArsR family regulator
MKKSIKKQDLNKNSGQMKKWTFISNHGHLLIYLAQNEAARVRDMAEAVGITERAIQIILSDFEEAAIIKKIKEGRRNRYKVNHQIALRHPLEAHKSIGDLIAMINKR